MQTPSRSRRAAHHPDSPNKKMRGGSRLLICTRRHFGRHPLRGARLVTTVRPRGRSGLSRPRGERKLIAPPGPRANESMEWGRTANRPLVRSRRAQGGAVSSAPAADDEQGIKDGDDALTRCQAKGGTRPCGKEDEDENTRWLTETGIFTVPKWHWRCGTPGKRGEELPGCARRTAFPVKAAGLNKTGESETNAAAASATRG
jgi:hypothetical protein